MTTTILSPDQVKTLGSPFTLVPAPGPGKFINWKRILVRYIPGTTHYDCSGLTTPSQIGLGTDPIGATPFNWQSQPFDLVSMPQRNTGSLVAVEPQQDAISTQLSDDDVS